MLIDASFNRSNPVHILQFTYALLVALQIMYRLLQTLLTYGPSDFSGHDLSKKGLQGRNMVYKLLLSELLSDRESIAPVAAATATATAAANGAAGGLGGRWIDR
jgi:hypothetical protein